MQSRVTLIGYLSMIKCVVTNRPAERKIVLVRGLYLTPVLILNKHFLSVSQNKQVSLVL